MGARSFSVLMTPASRAMDFSTRAFWAAVSLCASANGWSFFLSLLPNAAEAGRAVAASKATVRAVVSRVWRFIAGVLLGVRRCPRADFYVGRGRQDHLGYGL